MSRIIDQGRAREMVVTARRFDAREALAWGLVNEAMQAFVEKRKPVPFKERAVMRAFFPFFAVAQGKS
ncbi:MAG: hypothetical protein LUE17_10725 [Planctomycetaceae bacterium]|nr:hypothetical protein [Planctomycetaceae bacterium]